MFKRSFLRAGVIASATALLAACGDSSAPTSAAPAAAPQLEVVNPAVSANTLRRNTPIHKGTTVSATINNRKGGSISIPEAGFSLYIPENALPKSKMTITVTVVPGKSVAYEFGPHGTVFSKPIYFVQDLGNTNYDALTMSALEVGYFQSAAQLNDLLGEALVNEFLSTALYQDAKYNFVYAPIEHFSGYLVSTGRRPAMGTSDY
jgi:hypothetical protein